MLVAILSDIHDNVWKLAAALEGARTADALLCLGDLCSPFVVHQLGSGFAGPIHILFGNNDGDLFRIASNARRHAHITIHAEWFRGDFAGRSFAANHYDNIGRAVAAGGQFDVVCFGHNHRHEITPMGKTLAINPGAIMGAAFAADGTRTDIASTYVIYDCDSGQAERVEV
jgi:putative phosphoesterase